jgi:hypothetical protein
VEAFMPPSSRAASNQSLTGKYFGFGNDPIVVVGIGCPVMQQSLVAGRVCAGVIPATHQN